MSQPSNPHPHWWREIKVSGRTSLGVHIVKEGHNDFVAQHYALWEAAAFRLPVAQQEASEWWDTHPYSIGFVHRISYLPLLPQTPGLQGLEAGKDVALAQALQACVEASGAQTGILCEAAREL